MRSADSPRVHAVGWATVDLERAARELSGILEPGAGFEDAAACRALGARCRVGSLSASAAAAIGHPGAAMVVLLEPATEGRLAATLARHGEGWCATWEFDDATEALAATGPGPFGDERLAAGGVASGPHRILVRTATIGA